jgi:5-methyltetrahydrofolate--homocysteine methyltransferase
VQLTEALAEYWHLRVRHELGISAADPADLDGFFSVKYQGARYSIGYPACPDLADRAKIARLLQPERIGVELSEEMQLHPEQSTDAIVVHHPAARYFSV